MLNKRVKYGNDWDVPSAEHPAGACKNRSAPGVEDGSYFEKSWVNDLMALSGAVMTAAGYSPNGTEDTAVACQVFDALLNKKWTQHANYEIGTIVKGSDGNQYYCNQANGRDSAVKDPVSDATDSWRRYPYKEEVGGNSEVIKKWFNGDMSITGLSSSGVPNLTKIVFPVPFTVLNSVMVSIDRSDGSMTVGVKNRVLDGFNIVLNGTSSGYIVSYEANGKWA